MKLPRRLLPLPSVTAIAFALCACAGSPPNPQAGTAPFHLLPHQSIDVAPGVTLTYDSLSDSRCPPDVKCIWAGKLSYQFTLTSGRAHEPFSLGPGQSRYAPAALPDRRIVLDESVIPPARQSQAAPVNHPVTLKVETR
jgi:hypothetical protein